jgi:flagellar basal-body rod protein FlgC
MSTVHGIARSGLDAAARRLEVSAGNLANALTPGYQPARIEASQAAGGGVTTTVSRPADPLAEVRADRALLAASGTDPVAEVVAQSQASALFRANLAALATADELLDAAAKLVR